jgi:hypothetical protein
MKRAAVLITILLAMVATGCASAPTRATDTALAQHGATPVASLKTVVVNCLYKQQTRPSSFILTCADAGDVLAHLRWVSWEPDAAFATGVEQINDCTPYCAAGKFINYPVLVDLWRPEPLPGHPGVLYFSRVTRVYTANRPPLYFCNGKQTCYPQTSTFDLWHQLAS